MKIALFGQSPIALEAALRLNSYEAALTWFNATDVEVESFYSSHEASWSEWTTELGLSTLQKSGAQDPKSIEFSWDHWKKYYYSPLVEFLKTTQVIKPYQVTYLSKRYLAPFEQIKGTSRLQDLFRVIYELNPTQFIQEQKENNPETYERLTDEFVNSLQSSIEMFEDFDLVMDLNHHTQVLSAAPTGRALGESRVSKDKIHYGFEAIMQASSYLNNPEIRELVLIGSGFLAAETLLKLQDWIKDERNRLFIVTTEEEPFEKVLKLGASGTVYKLRELFREIEERFEKEINEFHGKLKAWQAMDDFVQAKYPRPVEPIPQVNYFSGHNLTAIDQLIDKRRLFITLEKPDFRNGKKHPDNNALELKTLGVDEILVAHDPQKKIHGYLIDHNERGFFSLSPNTVSKDKALEKNLIELKGIEDEIFKIFSPAASL